MSRIDGPPLIPHVNPISLYIPPLSPSSSPNPSHDYHVFFVPGNPGCIAYYNDFLSFLAKNLSLQKERCEVRRVHVYGHSLANFTKERVNHNHELKAPRKLLSLQEQIQYVEAILEQYVHSSQAEYTDQGFTNGKSPPPLKIILVGHSVGAYVCMEVLRRRRAKEKMQTERPDGSSGLGRMKLIGFIGLWPTITWIGQSPSGRRISLQPPGKGGKSLLMGLDEMKEITADRWDEDIWGAVEPALGNQKLKLIFYFGQNDHWVADHTRDDLIATRTFQEGRPDTWKPKMLVDSEGHSSTTANKTAEFVYEIMLADQKPR
ncbi:MAG: hypothetical protein Q9187_007795 [Circinaria calcarea]